ncbi:MAG: PAC2 family protein [Aigarchaeota archaeon]|nr:PAC2 family protein [Aigarchaeota archaeon]MDW8093190.1 PAC2 family protein [Nitrososphaerota archaeon]
MSDATAPFHIDMKSAQKKTSIIEGFPDVGLVGTIATSYLISQLDSSVVGHMRLEDLPPIITVQNSKIYEPCRLYLSSADNRKKFYIAYSDVPIPLSGIETLASVLVEMSNKLDAPNIISVGGLAEPTRIDIERPQVYVISNDEELMRLSLSTGMTAPLENGFITGIKAALIREANLRGSRVLIALAQSHFRYPDPGAAAEIVAFLNKLLGIEVPIDPLVREADELKMRLRDLMRRTASHLTQLPKGLEMEQAPGYIR